jgi:2-phosphosulfolactate phosphatase
MPRELTVHLLPTLFEPSNLRGGIAVVVDILRASTTITHALANGASRIIPCETIEDALATRAELGEDCLLGGERGGEIIEGFDLGNSPTAYSRAAVSGRTVAFTTTNGTRALLRSAEASRVLVGAFANLDAVVNLLKSGDEPVHLVCAGTDGFVSTEDTLFAGAVCEQLESASEFDLNDSAQLARNHWRKCSDSDETLLNAVLSGRGGQNVTRLGLGDDIRVALSRNGFDLVPEFLPQSRAIAISRTPLR